MSIWTRGPANSGQLEAGRSVAAQRQTAHGSRRRAQAHGRYVEPRRTLRRWIRRTFHLLRRPGGPGARRSRRSGRPDHGDPDGQVHRAGPGADRSVRHGRQGRARTRGHRSDPQAPLGLSDGGRRRGLSGLESDQGRARGRIRGSRHGSDLRIHRAGHAGDRRRRFDRRIGAQDRAARMAGADRKESRCWWNNHKSDRTTPAASCRIICQESPCAVH